MFLADSTTIYGMVYKPKGRFCQYTYDNIELLDTSKVEILVDAFRSYTINEQYYIQKFSE